MGERIVAEYGFWQSPITADLVAGKSIRLNEPILDGGAVYWLEGRPLRGRSYRVGMSRPGR